MSAGMGKPQEWPRWEEKFSHMFVIMLSATKPTTRLKMSLAKERDFLSSAEGPDPEEDVSFPDYCLCGLKRSSALTVPPVFKVGAGQLGSSCPHNQQGLMEGVLETTSRLGLGVPPALVWCALHQCCSKRWRERSQAAATALSWATLCLGSAGLQCIPPGRRVSPDLRHSQELSGFAGRMRERGRDGHGNQHPGCSPEGVVETSPSSSPYGSTEHEIANPKSPAVRSREGFGSVV